MSDSNIMLAFSCACLGSTCLIERREHDWLIDFGKGRIVVAAPWRIVSNGRIVFGSEDDRQQFGLRKSIDGEALANKLLNKRRIASIEIDHATADFQLHFDGDVRLDVFNQSMGFEGWQAQFEGEIALIIGRGGGGVVIV